MAFSILKHLLPDRAIPLRIRAGPMRGARIVANPRNSIRKILGIYEHELSGWMETVLREVHRVIDVGAYDGYYTLGCASAFRRLGKSGEVIAFEPQEEFLARLRESVDVLTPGAAQITLIPQIVGCRVHGEMTTLDAIRCRTGEPEDRTRTLLKIDVEGAELEVLEGAGSWINPHNRFLIEVHRESYIDIVTQMFKARNLDLKLVHQRRFGLLPREERDAENWWLVSKIQKRSGQ